ncbi:protein zwilch homolog isoform X2 [Clupea harengus]|uniref:Protein zwilch n=1 Tax=Clupea harengus TaxID=7950 RepID=A0A6P8EWM7_CLUHA|nr:protein zwilch homolog isoform X2 [Clupea harengus]
MGSKIISDANRFVDSLKLCQENDADELIYEDNIQISLVKQKVPLHKLICGNLPVLVVGKKLYLENAQEREEDEEDSLPSEDLLNDEGSSEQQCVSAPQPLTLTAARQLLSWYTMSQNPNMPTVLCPPLLPLWVRCDMSDALGTTWLGAETVSAGNKVSGIKLYTICSKEATEDKSSFISLDALMELHQKRHHASAVETKGYAQYNLFGSIVVENTVIESQCSITAVFKWSNVEKVFQMPPQSSEAVLDIKLAIGDMKSPLYETYKELEFLETLAQGLRTGEAEWPDPTDPRSAMDLTKALVEELESIGKTGQGQAGKGAETQREAKPDTPAAADKGINIYSSVGLDRGDLDFTDQLWVKMRSSISSYQDIIDCLKMVISAVKHGQIKPWVHRNSSNSLGRVILQSYKQKMEAVCLTGLTPVHMLLEMGLDKMRKDYINYLIGRELTTLNNLSYYMCTDVDLQEQVTRVKKLHHLLEILVICSTFLSLPYECLFPFIQSCLKYYKTSPYDEEHVFQMQIRPVVISNFYQKEEPMSWGAEVFSGQGSREVRTSFHLSDQPLVDHVTFSSDLNKTTANGDKEETAFFSTTVTHSLINFI